MARYCWIKSGGRSQHRNNTEPFLWLNWASRWFGIIFRIAQGDASSSSVWQDQRTCWFPGWWSVVSFSFKLNWIGNWRNPGTVGVEMSFGVVNPTHNWKSTTYKRMLEYLRTKQYSLICRANTLRTFFTTLSICFEQNSEHFAAMKNFEKLALFAVCVLVFVALQSAQAGGELNTFHSISTQKNNSKNSSPYSIWSIEISDWG